MATKYTTSLYTGEIKEFTSLQDAWEFAKKGNVFKIIYDINNKSFLWDRHTKRSCYATKELEISTDDHNRVNYKKNYSKRSEKELVILNSLNITFRNLPNSDDKYYFLD